MIFIQNLITYVRYNNIKHKLIYHKDRESNFNITFKDVKQYESNEYMIKAIEKNCDYFVTGTENYYYFDKYIIKIETL